MPTFNDTDLESDIEASPNSLEEPEPAPVQAPERHKTKKKGKTNGVRRKGLPKAEEESAAAGTMTSSLLDTKGVLIDVPPAFEPTLGVVPPEGFREEPMQSTTQDQADRRADAALSPVRSPQTRPASIPSLPPVDTNGLYYGSSASPPVSPPTRMVVPYHNNTNSYSGPGVYRPHSTIKPQDNHRRPSGYVNSAFRRTSFVEAPPPHMPQGHFYRTPSFGLGSVGQGRDKGKVAGSDGYCCILDSFADSGDAASSKQGKDVLLIGSEGVLEVCRVLRDKCEVIGRLGGLYGSVIGAKILPWTGTRDPLRAMRPLVAVIIHGRKADGVKLQSGIAHDTPLDLHYHTSVEVFSLRQQYATTLYRSAPVTVKAPLPGYGYSPAPPPIGDLQVSARGRFVTVASGKSGELWIFTPSPAVDFRCIGKYWTALQTKAEALGSRPASSTDASSSQNVTRERNVPLYSLSKRWLAIVPPSTSMQTSIRGTPVLSDARTNPPGLDTHAAPTQPAENCSVVAPGPGGVVQRTIRTATKEILKASRAAGGLIMQGWNELNGTPLSEALRDRTFDVPPDDEAFPPNNAPSDDGTASTREPTLVSIIDLQQQLNNSDDVKPRAQLPPLATFPLPDGCNFISISPGGLRLLTTNRKGDISRLWDLTHVAHGSKRDHAPASDLPALDGPYVKHVCSLLRESPSTIIDVKWSAYGDMLAVLTEHGTVHLHDLPEISEHASRPKKKAHRPEPADKADATLALSPGNSPPSNGNSGFLGGVMSGWQNFNSHVSAVRSRTSSASFGLHSLKGLAATASTAGKRAVKEGVRQSYSAATSGASSLWHSEDNKLRLKPAADGVAPGRILWTAGGRCKGCIAAVAAGMVHIYPVQHVVVSTDETAKVYVKAAKSKHPQYSVPVIATVSDRPASAGEVGFAEVSNSFWTLHCSFPGKNIGNTSSALRITSQAGAAESEASPHWTPFHDDLRVTMYTFSDTTAGAHSELLDLDDTTEQPTLFNQGYGSDLPWVFGLPLPLSVKMSTARSSVSEMDEYGQGITESQVAELDAMNGLPARQRGRGRRFGAEDSAVREYDEDGFEVVREDDGDI